MKIAYFDCFSGISGDMTLGALVDLGIEPDLLQGELAKLKLDEYKLNFTKVKKHGITATKANVDLHHHDHHDHHHGRHLGEILKMIFESELSDEIKEKSKRVFTHLGEAEAKVHGVSIEEVHFHEVGAVDSIVDIVGSVIGITILGIEKIYSSPLPLGQGFVKSSHGIVPVPAPATAELLKGVPTQKTEIQAELVTPTGAAIISTLAEGFGSIPEMLVDKVGYGSGTKEFAEQPNLLRIILGDIKNAYESDIISIVETNIDDMSPQIYDSLIDKLLALGAVDVYMTPIVMKKSRPAIKLTALVDSAHLQDIYTCILAETTTMGVRVYEANRKKLSREMVDVETEYGKVSVKLGKIGDETVKVLPEYDDCKRLSEKNNVPIIKIHQAVFKTFFN